MSGNPQGRIDCLHGNTIDYNRAQELFKNIFDKLDGHSGTTRKALYHGANDSGTGADGNGTGYPGVNGFGNGAFAVFTFDTTNGRAWSYDVLIQLRTGSSTAGNPLQVNGGNAVNGSGEVCVSVAVGTAESPWNGTTANDGTDSKGTPVWSVSSGELIVLPASNATDGADGTDKDNTSSIVISATSVSRCSFICDDDSFVILSDASNNGSLSGIVGVMPFEPTSAFVCATPLMMIGHSSLPPSNGDMGRDRSGAVMTDTMVAAGEEAKAIMLSLPDVMSSVNTPGEITGAITESRVVVATTESGSREIIGIADGFMRISDHLTGYNTNQDLSRVFVTATNGAVLSFPWDSTTTPQTAGTRAGVDF